MRSGKGCKTVSVRKFGFVGGHVGMSTFRKTMDLGIGATSIMFLIWLYIGFAMRSGKGCKTASVHKFGFAGGHVGMFLDLWEIDGSWYRVDVN